MSAGSAPVRRWLARHRDVPAPAPAPAPAVLHEAGPHFVIAPGPARGAAGGTADGTEATAVLPADLADALALLPAVVGTVTVLAAAADAQPVLLAGLDELARTAAARRAATLVLAASGLAAGQADGRRPAQRIAELAATSIVAPDGVVTLRPDGTLLSGGAEDGEPSSWWLFTPAGRTRRLGPVWPLPETAAAPAGAAAARARAADPAGAVPAVPAVPVAAGAVPAALPSPAPAPAPTPAALPAPVAGTAVPVATGPVPAADPVPDPVPDPAALPAPVAGTAVPVATGPTAPRTPPPPAPSPVAGGDRDPFDGDPLVTVLPRGYWFRDEPAPDVRPGLLARTTATPGTLVLVVGHPGAPLPEAAGVAERLRRVHPAPDDLLVSAPWAPTTALVALAAALAAELGHDVRAAVGLPMRTGDGCSARILDADGIPGWEPWLTELTASPGRGRVVASAWRPLPDGTTSCGPALYRAPVAGWCLEAVPAGLWLRPEDPPLDHGPRLLDPDPARPVLIAGVTDRTVPAEVLAAVDGLLTALTVPGAAVPGLLLNAGPAPETARPAVPDRTPLPDAPDTEPEPGPSVPPAGPDPDGADTDPGPGFPEPPTWAATSAGPDTTGGPRAPAPARTPLPDAPDTEPDPEPAPEAAPVGPGAGPAAVEPAVTEPVPVVPEPVPVPGPVSVDPTAGPDGDTGNGDSDAGDTEGTAVSRLVAPDGAFPAGRPSTPAERAAFRALLGPHFHRYASRAEQVALRLPALRSQARDDLKDDLAAVYLHHADTGLPASRAELVAAARRPGGAGALDPYLACLGSGLRRLPNHRGPVLLGADADEEVLRHYVRDALLTEPAPLVGTPEADLLPGTSAEFLVWSATGRRTSVIAEDGDPEVVFPPGARFLVLDVLPGADERPARVLLREADAVPAADGAAAERNQQARARLLAWQARRDQLTPDQLRPPARPERLGLTPGVATG
ncbi:hypothetical protein [Kitasatospora sp. NPDC085464]|uniref:hypothetical protein n=1 Tax=Kitasatospora sp. NPDC085464 TaxID=3364063 RepID=UPI0037C86146